MRKALLAAGLLLLLPALSVPAQRRQEIKMPSWEGPPQHLIFTVKVAHREVAEFKAFVREAILPVLSSSDRIVGLETYSSVIGEDFSFIFHLRVKPGVSLSSFDSAVEIFSNGRDPMQALATLNHLAEFAQEKSSMIVIRRPDLSIDRSTAGTMVAEETRKGGQR